MKYRILIADDEAKIRRVMTLLLEEAGYQVTAVENGAEAVDALVSFDPHIVLLDYQMPVLSGIEALEKIKSLNSSQTVIMITAFGSVSLVVEAIKKGAYDFIEKPFDNDKLLLTIQRAIDHTGLKDEVRELKQRINRMVGKNTIIGRNGGLKMVMEQVQMVSATSASVLLIGESGSGKELVARAVHENSQRNGKPFVAINCGAIPVSLIESELFGHEKGAFTDAKESRQGTFEKAHTGTLFLDEIGELSSDAQIRLLRVLEEKKINRVGGKQSISIDVRIIAATHRDLEELVKTGSFRLDLFYRLNVFIIKLPALRERKEDIPELANYFIDKYNPVLGLKVEGLSASTMSCLCDYNWPGNVRDLENAIQSAMILTRSGIIEPSALPVRIHRAEESANEESLVQQDIRGVTDQAEKELILEVLKRNGNNRSITAVELGISRKTLFNKMRKYGIQI
ncbi:MAG: sigma-54 dependent transcriptional regulator [Sphingobacteriia bacterium]|nr:sigma-54 dependent transcriptional regulator [Sphingobacteriia bacterium]